MKTIIPILSVWQTLFFWILQSSDEEIEVPQVKANGGKTAAAKAEESSSEEESSEEESSDEAEAPTKATGNIPWTYPLLLFIHNPPNFTLDARPSRAATLLNNEQKLEGLKGNSSIDCQSSQYLVRVLHWADSMEMRVSFHLQHLILRW